MKKGFTLIELLAVIVILAIVALIATPIILNVIDKAKVGAAESSAIGYIEAIESQVIINDINNKNLLNDGVYDVDTLESKDVSIKGSKPSEGYIKIEDGIVKNCSIRLGDYVVNCTNKYRKFNVTKGGEIDTSFVPSEVIPNGTAIYFNPETGKKCSAASSNSETGTKTGCMKWYVFNDDGEKEKVDVLLDHNTTNFISLDDSYKKILNGDTGTWKSELNARFIYDTEIMNIFNNTNEVETSNISSVTFLQSNTYVNGDYIGYCVDSSDYYSSWAYYHTPGGRTYETDYDYDDNGKLIYVLHNYVEGYYLSQDWIYEDAKIGIRPVISIPRTSIR